MGGVDVVRLTERFLGDLPIGVDDLGHMGLLVSLLQIPDREVVIEFTEKIRERLSVGVGVDEDKAGPGTNRYFREMELLGNRRGESPNHQGRA